jgi:hypothetical protein
MLLSDVVELLSDVVELLSDVVELAVSVVVGVGGGVFDVAVLVAGVLTTATTTRMARPSVSSVPNTTGVRVAGVIELAPALSRRPCGGNVRRS